MSIYFITSERAYLRETQSKRDKASELNMFGIERGRKRMSSGGSGEEKPQKARTDPGNIAKSVCSACLDRARSIKPRERSFSSPRDPGRAIPTSPMCTLLLPIIRCEPEGLSPSFPPWWISILPIEAAISFHVLCPCPGDNLTNSSWKHERMRRGCFHESYRMDLVIWKRKFLKVNNGIECTKFSCWEFVLPRKK